MRLAIPVLLLGIGIQPAIAQQPYAEERFDQVRQRLWQETESATATSERQVFAIRRLAMAESERGHHDQAIRFLELHQEVGGKTENVTTRLHWERALESAKSGDVQQTVEQLNQIEGRYRIETALKAVEYRIHADDMKGVQTIVDSLQLPDDFQQAREYNLVPWIELLTANRLAEQGHRMEALEYYSTVMETMKQRQQVIQWNQLPTFGIRRVSKDMMARGFVEEAVAWPVERIYEDSQNQLGYYTPERVAGDLLEHGYVQRAWQLHEEIDDAHRRSWLMASVAEYLADHGETMDADDRFREALANIEGHQVTPAYSLFALLVRVARKLDQPELARELVQQQAARIETVEKDKRHYDRLIDLYLSIDDPDSAEQVMTNDLGNWHHTAESIKIAKYLFDADREPERIDRLMKTAAELTVHAGAGAAVGGRGMPVMRSDNYQRAIVALTYLEMQRFDEAAALLRKITEGNRHTAVYGVSSVNDLLWDDAMINRWLEEVQPDERLHALAGIYVGMDKLNRRTINSE